jgi:hypothetical protein
MAILRIRHGWPQVSFPRTSAVPRASVCSLAKAAARGRYFMPQSGAEISRSAGT